MKYLIIVLFWFGLLNSSKSQNLESIAKQKPVIFSGSVHNSAQFYSTTDTNSMLSPFSYVLSGNFNLSLYGINMPFSVLYSNQNYNYVQPFNRIGFSPEYKWLKLHLGYRSVTHSSLTLAGHTFLGGGVEINPVNLRFSYVYGRFKKKTVANSVNPLDSLIAPSRVGYSMKLGFGNEKNYIDFIFLKIEDDTLSNRDSSIVETYEPLQGNMVLGTRYYFSLGKRVSWETEAAVSLLTKDLNPVDEFEYENEILQKFDRFFDVNQTTEFSTAIRSSLQYSLEGFNAGLEYRRIDPNYQSFGAYYFNTDLENITLNSSLRLFNRKLLLRGSTGLQNDDLKGNKNRKSRRLISRFNFDYNSGKVFAINGNYSNYSINQFSGRLPLNDTIKLYQINRGLSVSPRLNFVSENIVQMLMLNITVMDLIDHNRFTSENNEVSSSILMLNYIRNYTSLGLNLSAGISRSNLSSSFEDRTLTGYSLGAGKMFFNRKLNVQCTLSNSLSKADNEIQETEGKVRNIIISANYRLQKHTFKVNMFFNYVQYPSVLNTYKRDESKIICSYGYTF